MIWLHSWSNVLRALELGYAVEIRGGWGYIAYHNIMWTTQGD